MFLLNSANSASERASRVLMNLAFITSEVVLGVGLIGVIIFLGVEKSSASIRFERFLGFVLGVASMSPFIKEIGANLFFGPSLRLCVRYS